MAAVTRKRGAENYFIWGLSGEELSKLNISSQSKAQCWFRKRKTELKIIEETKICTPAMLKPYSASSFCLPNKNRVGVAHGDGTNLEVVYNTTCSPASGRLLIHHLVPEPTHESQCMQDGRRAMELVETNLTSVSKSEPWNSFSGTKTRFIIEKNERKHIFLDSSGRPLDALWCRLSEGNLVLVSGLLTWKWPVCQRSIPAAI